MSFEDKLIVCEDCGREFVHSASDQARYAERGFTNDPKRCRECRDKRKAQSAGGSRGGGRRPGGPGGSRGPRGGGRGGDARGRPPRESYEIVCAACGAAATVPFKPEQGRPVYCRNCYRSQRDSE